jgi:iron(III) transport system permease protein
MRAPRWLWVLAVAAVTPSIVPLALLAWAALSGGATTGGIPVERLFGLLGSTGMLVVSVTGATMLLGVTTAWLTTRTNLPGKRAWSTLVTLPMVIPSYVGALALLGASGNGGVLSALTTAVGLPALPTFRGFWAAWAALTLWNFPFVHLLASPALRRMNPALEEVARSLGATRWRTFRTIVLPQLRPAMAASSLLVALYTISDFGAVSLLRYETFTRAIYAQFRGRIDITPALFLSGVLMIVALGVVLVERRVRGRLSYHAERPPRPARVVTLSPLQRTLARAVLGGTVVCSLLLPAGVLVSWTARGLTFGLPIGSVLAETGRAAMVGGAAAVVTVAAAIPLAVLTVRHRSAAAGWLESISWSTYSLPHLAVGLAFLVFALRLLPVAYQGLPLLVMAYTAVFLPQALGATQSALRQVGRQLEEASRGLGHSAASTLRRIVIPLIAPGLATGGALVFLTTMKELPVTLMLRPTGFETLAVRIWSSASEGLYTRASAAALVLIAVSALPLYLLVPRDDR